MPVCYETSTAVYFNYYPWLCAVSCLRGMFPTYIYPLDTPCVYSGFLPAILTSFLFWPGNVLSVHERCVISNRAVYVHSVSSLGNRVN
jgi:hypothetical protein